MKTHYDVLGVPPNADDAMIRMAFRKAAKICHPDLNRDPVAEQRFKQITAAYAVLSNPEQRAAFDRHLRLIRQQVWREWRITVMSWIVAGILGAGFASGSAWLVRSKVSIKEVPGSSAVPRTVETEAAPGEGAHNIDLAGAHDRQTVVVATPTLRGAQPITPEVPSEDRNLDQQSPPVTAPTGHPTLGDLAGEPVRNTEPDGQDGSRADVAVAAPPRAYTPMLTARALNPSTAEQAMSSNAATGRHSVRAAPAAGSKTRARANVRTSRPASQGDYIFYEHSSTHCGTDDNLDVPGAIRDPPLLACAGSRGHRVLRHRGVRERRAAVRRARSAHA